MSDTSVSVLRHVAAATAREHVLIRAWHHKEGGMTETADKVAALLDAARALDAISAPYALIGGVAVGVHSGVPRATLDTDLAVRSTLDRAKVVRTLIDAGFQLVGEHAHSSNLRHAGGEPLQLAFDPAFDALIDRAESFTVETVPIRIVRKGDLIEMKRRAAADPKWRKSKALRDQADIELLLGGVPDPDEGW
jgi:hypothetical protein